MRAVLLILPMLLKLGKSNAVSVMVTLPGQEPQRATFSIKRPSSTKAK